MNDKRIFLILSGIFHFREKYFLLSILFLAIEILIAKYANDPIIRPYAGDYLVVILLYCMLRSIIKIRILLAALSVLLFSFLIEASQYFKLADFLKLPHGSLARILLGDYFTWIDILSYSLGILTVLGFESVLRRRI